MKLVRKGPSTHRGVIGVESAIVMIAFVIVAAALAFVVLNMGFSTTQRAKTAVISSLGEASSSLEIAGKVTGVGDVSASLLNVTNVPVKIASGGDSINMNPSLTSIAYLSNSIQYDDIYVGILTDQTYRNVTYAFDNADGLVGATYSYLNANSANGTGSDPGSSGNADATAAVVYFSVDRNNNFILDQGEHANIAIQHKYDERPGALDHLRIEILLPTGAALTIERQVPNITNLAVDLG